MEDIVNELTANAANLRKCNRSVDDTLDADLCERAAATIARLTAERDRIAKRRNEIDDEAYDYAEQVEDLKRENARLIAEVDRVTRERDGLLGLLARIEKHCDMGDGLGRVQVFIDEEWDLLKQWCDEKTGRIVPPALAARDQEDGNG